MSLLRTFTRFWWDFVVGDDWRASAGIAGALGLVWLLVHRGGDPWWLLPLAVAAVLALSLRREARLAEPAQASSSRRASSRPGSSRK